MITLLHLAFYLSIPVLQADDTPVGFWKSIDDNTGAERSVVEIYQEGDKVFGSIRALLEDDDEALCDACKGKDHNKPIVGLQIIKDLEKQDLRWEGGTILDPESGGVYKCIIWLEDKGKVLKVRGKHWTGLYRTQTWHRTEARDQ